MKSAAPLGRACGGTRGPGVFTRCLDNPIVLYVRKISDDFKSLVLHILGSGTCSAQKMVQNALYSVSNGHDLAHLINDS